MKIGSLRYALKTWQTAVFLAPFIIVAGSLIKWGSIGDALMLFAFGAVAGMVFSIPSALLFWLAAYTVSRHDIPWHYKKVILSVIGIALTFLAFMLYADGALPGKALFTYLLVYSAVIVAGVWIYQLKPLTRLRYRGMQGALN